MIYQKVVKYPKLILEGGEPSIRRSDIKNIRSLWPTKTNQRGLHTNFVEGWMAVNYNSKFVGKKETALLERLASLSKNCYLSDDLVISFVLSNKGIKFKGIDNKYIGNPHPYYYGHGKDALHRGGGAGEGLKSQADLDDYNFEKYNKCLQDICKAGLGPKKCEKALDKPKSKSKRKSKRKSRKKR